MSRKISSSIFGASVILTLISLTAKGFGFLREMIYAKEFGLGEDFNAFLVSSILPIIIYSMIYYLGQLYFIPAYHRILNRYGEEEGKIFFSQNTFIFFGSGWIIYFILLLFSDQLIAVYLQSSTEEIRATALEIFKVFILTVPFASGHAILSAHLNAESKFTFPALSNLLMNILIVTLLYFFSDRYGIILVPFVFVLGWAGQFFYLLFISRKFIFLSPAKIIKKNASLRLINSTLLLTILIEVITLSYTFVDRYFLGEVGEGGIASLSYAAALWEMPVKIISFALGTVIFSKLSSAFSRRESDEVIGTFYKGIKITVFIFTPIAFIMYYWGDFLIGLLYQRGKFTANDTAITAEVLSIYAISLIFFSAYAIVNKMLYSSRLLKQLLIISSIGLSLKVVLNFILTVQFMQNGLAISSTVSYSFICISGYYIAAYKNKFPNKSIFVKGIIIALMNAGISLLIAQLIASVMFEGNYLEEISGLTLFILFYGINAYFTNTEDFYSLIKISRSFISKG